MVFLPSVVMAAGRASWRRFLTAFVIREPVGLAESERVQRKVCERRRLIDRQSADAQEPRLPIVTGP
jgi:hypothetical protein